MNAGQLIQRSLVLVEKTRNGSIFWCTNYGDLLGKLCVWRSVFAHGVQSVDPQLHCAGAAEWYILNGT